MTGNVDQKRIYAHIRRCDCACGIGIGRSFTNIIAGVRWLCAHCKANKEVFSVQSVLQMGLLVTGIVLTVIIIIIIIEKEA